MKKDDFNLEAFKFIRQEINNRIDTHYKMLIYKLAFSGAIFSFIYQKENIIISPFFISAIFSFVMDIIIIENLGWIRNSGLYIKFYIENTQENIIKWECNFAQNSNKWACFTPFGYILGIWVFSLFWFIGGIINWSKNTINLFSVLLIIFLVFYTLFLIFKNLSSTPIFNNQTNSPINTEPNVQS